MAAAVKHARIDAAITSPTPGQGKYLTTGGSSEGAPGSGQGSRRGSHFGSPTKDEIRPPGMAAPQGRSKSTFKGISQGLLSMRRMTKSSLDSSAAAAVAAAAAAAAAKPKIRMENTFRLEPSEQQHFNSGKGRAAIQEVLDQTLKDQKYNAAKAPTLAAVLSERIKAAVRGLHCDRHKLVASVVVGPCIDQGLVVASRCLWDTSSDSCSTVTFNNGNIFAIATVYAVYYE